MTITDTSIDTTGLVAGTWTIDPSHSEVGFTVRHLMTKVRGQFEKFEGKVATGASLEDTRTEASIDLNSVNTRDAQRDGHLRSADFFDVANSGPMTFAAPLLRRQHRAGRPDHQGRDQARSSSTSSSSASTPTPTATCGSASRPPPQINRKDYGVDFDIPLDGGKFLVGHKVDIQLSIQAVLDQS